MKVYYSPEGYIEGLRQTAIAEGRKPIPVTMDLGAGLFISAEVPTPGPRNPNESEADYLKRVEICRRAAQDIADARKEGAESTTLQVVPPSLDAEFQEFLAFKAAKAAQAAAKASEKVAETPATKPQGAAEPAELEEKTLVPEMTPPPASGKTAKKG